MSSINFIKKELTFNSNIETVWNAITDPEHIRCWFGDNAVFELQEGANGYFEWRNFCEGKYAMRIKSIRKPTYFAWYWMNDPDTEFNQDEATLVEWTLTATVNGKTQLSLIESGFKQEEHRKMNVKGWNTELDHLWNYLSHKQN